MVVYEQHYSVRLPTPPAPVKLYDLQLKLDDRYGRQSARSSAMHPRRNARSSMPSRELEQQVKTLLEPPPTAQPNEHSLSDEVHVTSAIVPGEPRNVILFPTGDEAVASLGTIPARRTLSGVRYSKPAFAAHSEVPVTAGDSMNKDKLIDVARQLADSSSYQLAIAGRVALRALSSADPDRQPSTATRKGLYDRLLKSMLPEERNKILAARPRFRTVALRNRETFGWPEEERDPQFEQDVERDIWCHRRLTAQRELRERDTTARFRVHQTRDHQHQMRGASFLNKLSMGDPEAIRIHRNILRNAFRAAGTDSPARAAATCTAKAGDVLSRERRTFPTTRQHDTDVATFDPLSKRPLCTPRLSRGTTNIIKELRIRHPSPKPRCLQYKLSTDDQTDRPVMYMSYVESESNSSTTRT